MSDVIQIEELRIRRQERSYQNAGQCQHMHLRLEDGDVVMCEDCGKQVAAFWALEMLADHYARAQEKLARAQAAHQEAVGKGVVLRAAQRVEAAWRSRTMVPCCPHCGEAVFSEDGFGGAQVNREIAERRRAKRGGRR